MAPAAEYIELQSTASVANGGDEHTALVASDDWNYKPTYDASIDENAERTAFASLRSKVREQQSSRSWQVLVASGLLTATLVLVINLATLIVAYTRFVVEDHVITIWTGVCDRASSIVVGAHLVINVLSSLLLAASNASMQCLGSPTRDEIDLAHNKGAAFTIGVPSVRNVLLVRRRKAALWLLLALSSLPLHLFWNSTVFQTLAGQNYYAMSVSRDFTTGAEWVDPVNGTQSWELDGMWQSIMRMQHLAQNNSLERLQRSDCIHAYGKELVADRRNVLMVTNSTGVDYGNYSSLIAIYASAFTPNASEASSENYASYSWMCMPPDGAQACDYSSLSHLMNHENEPWIPGYNNQEAIPDFDVCGNLGNGLIACGNQHGASVDYCLSEPVVGQCKVSLVPTFLIIVCICNALKIVTFVLTLRLAPREQTLVTQGDAIQSFIDRPDLRFSGMCLATKEDFMSLDGMSQIWSSENMPDGWRVRQAKHLHVLHAKAMQNGGADRTRRPWGAAAGGYHWTFTILVVLALLLALVNLFGKTTVTVGGQELSSKSEAWALILSQSLGQPMPSFRMGKGELSVLLAFFLANVPQLVLSYLYVDMNNLLTAMFGMTEWTSFYAARVAKGLRVSRPIPDTRQRSTYFLTLPFKFAAPSVLLFTLLHWLSSQMVFAAKIETYNADGALNAGTSITSVYYAPLVAIVLACLLGLTMLSLCVIGVIKHYPDGAPLAGNCSASIAAACQPESGKAEFEPGLARRALRCGVVELPTGEEGVGHVTFSDRIVGRVLPGEKYA